MEVAARMEQSLPSPTPAYYIGSGKVAEIQETVELLDIDYVIFEDALSPSQLKNLQKEIEASVMDRTSLILEIFSRRAKTREARLQVESASLQYMLPRLVGMRDSLGRQAGASGSLSNKGSGEKQIELDRRKIERRISELGRELDAIEHDRDIQRRKRSRSALPLAALVAIPTREIHPDEPPADHLRGHGGRQREGRKNGHGKGYAVRDAGHHGAQD